MIKQNVNNTHLLQKEHIEGELTDTNIRQFKLDLEALTRLHKGPSRPSYAVAGMLWINDSNTPIWELYVYDGSDDTLVDRINITDNKSLNGAITFWDTNITYAIGDFVLASDNNLYKAISSQFGNNPISNPDKWQSYVTSDLTLFKDNIALSSSAGLILNANSNKVYGHTWIQPSVPHPTATFARVKYFPILNKCFAVGTLNRGMYSIDDGVTWIDIGDFNLSPYDINDITYSNSLSRLVVVGDAGSISYSDDNGVSWTKTTDHDFGLTNIWSVTFSESLSMFVAVGASGKLCYSSNGITWVAADSKFGISTIRTVIFSEELSRFIAVGNIGKISYSDDGINWTLSLVTGFDGADEIYDVAFSRSLSMYVAVAENKKMSYSIDNGETWTSITVPAFGGGDTIYAVTFSDLYGKFIATGEYSYMIYSYNGIDWYEDENAAYGYSEGTQDIKSICSTPTNFVIVGEGGRAKYSKNKVANVLLNAIGGAPMYPARSWVNFNGITYAIRSSGNVSSITDESGDAHYGINFIIRMPDPNYAVVSQGNNTIGDITFRGTCGNSAANTVSKCFLFHQGVNSVNQTKEETEYINVIIFR